MQHQITQSFEGTLIDVTASSTVEGVGQLHFASEPIVTPNTDEVEIVKRSTFVYKMCDIDGNALTWLDLIPLCGHRIEVSFCPDYVIINPIDGSLRLTL